MRPEDNRIERYFNGLGSRRVATDDAAQDADAV